MPRRAGLLMSVGIGAPLLTACSAAIATAAHQHPRTLSVIKGGIIKDAMVAGENFDYVFPVMSASGESSVNIATQALLYQPLLYEELNEPTINYGGSLASRVVWSHNDTEVTVTLRHHRWSNGTPVTTRDVTFFVNLARAAGPEWGLYSPGGFPSNVKKMTIESPYQMTFDLTESYNPDYYVDNQLLDITPLPQNVWDRTSINGKVGNYDETPAGAKAVWNFLNTYAENTSTYTSTNKIWGDIDGAYKLASFGGSSSPDIFVPNQRYSGHRSTISKFEELPFTSDASEYDEVRSGTSAVTLGYVPADDIPTLPAVRSAGFTISVVHDWGIYYIIPNLANPTLGPVLRQLYVRQVLQSLVDQTTMIKDFLHGYGSPTYGPAPIYPSGNPFADSFERRNPYPYSPARARAILSSHGWRVVGGVETCEDAALCSSAQGRILKGTQLKLKLLYLSGDPEITEQNELFASDAAKVGITIDLVTEPVDSVIGVVSRCNPSDPTAPSCTWELGEYGGIGYYPFPNTALVFSSTGALNAGSFDSATADKLIYEVHHSSSLGPYHELENLLARQLPWIWQPTPSTVEVAAKNLRGPGINTEFESLEPNLWYFVRS